MILIKINPSEYIIIIPMRYPPATTVKKCTSSKFKEGGFPPEININVFALEISIDFPKSRTKLHGKSYLLKLFKEIYKLGTNYL